MTKSNNHYMENNTKIQICHNCNKTFNEKSLQTCTYHFCNECIYLWMRNCLIDVYSSEQKYTEICSY